MVAGRSAQFQYFRAAGDELDSLLRGRVREHPDGEDFLRAAPLRKGETGVLVAVGERPEEPNRPLALVTHDEDVRRLCSSYAQVRGQLSPLTSWCHLLSPKMLEGVEGIAHQPRLAGTEAAWSGLVIAETLLVTGVRLSKVRLASCLASATYAIGRTKALWPSVSIEASLERFQSANQLCRPSGPVRMGGARGLHVRSSFAPIWSCLAALTDGSTDSVPREDQPLVRALVQLQSARFSGEANEAGSLVAPLVDSAPEASALEALPGMSPEERLGLFDGILRAFHATEAVARLRRNALALSAGYLATVVAGGAASLPLVERASGRWPELTGWAYLAGSIGERTTWTSGFDGLGRLVARELQRGLRLDEAPTCDFALDEAAVLVDRALKDPLVHLKIKQARILSVALLPGVNTLVPIVDTLTPAGERRPMHGPRHAGTVGAAASAQRRDLFEDLAQALWPYLRDLVKETAIGSLRDSPPGRKQTRRKKKERTTGRLPLEGPDSPPD